MAPATGAAIEDVRPVRGSAIGDEFPVRRSPLDNDPLLRSHTPGFVQLERVGWAEEGEEALPTREGRVARAGALTPGDSERGGQGRSC